MTRLATQLAEKLRRQLDDGKPLIVPAGGDLIWQWFIDLSTCRSYHAAGPNPISWADLAAYCTLTGTAMRQDHIEAIRAMDAAFLDHAHSRREATASTLPPVSKTEMTPQLFDALFG